MVTQRYGKHYHFLYAQAERLGTAHAQFGKHGINEMPDEGNCTNVDLEALVIRLPERARMVFVLHALEGYRHEDIANMLNMAVGSSKAQLFRAKHLLRDFMGVDDE